MPHTVLITGAAGFIGFHLAKRILAETDAAVVGFDNLNAYYDVSLKESRLDLLRRSERFTFVRGDLTDRMRVFDTFEQFAPDVVVNLAAQAGVRYSLENPEAYMDSNVTGFFHMLEAARRFPVNHFVYASSSSVYGNRTAAPFSETDSVDRPVSLYAATKRFDELAAYTYAHLYGIQCTGLRFFTVYGPFGRPDMAYFSFTRKILAGEPIQIFNHGDLYRDFTYIDDVVTALMRILPAPPAKDDAGDRCRLMNIGNAHPEKLLHFLDVLQTVIGKRADVRFLPMQPGDVYLTAADTTRIEQEFGFAPNTSIETGLQAFYDWYRAYYGVTE